VIRPLLPLAVAALLAAPALHAQGTPPTAADSARAAVRAAVSDLRNLVTAQEAHYADHGRYGLPLQNLGGYQPSRGNAVGIVYADDKGWAAVLTSVRLVGTCSIRVGPLTLPADSARVVPTVRDKRVGKEAEAVCDRQPGEGAVPGGLR
jgi:hypothetical protein